ARRAGDVRALADHHEAGVGADHERLEAAERRLPPPQRHPSRGQAPGRVRDGPRMFGRGPAAAADDVDEAGAGELFEQATRVARLLVVAAEGVRETGIR